MDYHWSLEGVFKQLEITVSLPKAIPDTDIVDFYEEIGILPSCLQPTGILFDILDYRRETMVWAEIAVVEIRGEDICHFRESLAYQLTTFHLHHAYVTSQCIRQIFLGKYREMDVVGHDDVLEDPKIMTEIRKIVDLSLDDSANRRSFYSSLFRGAEYLREIGA